MLHLKVALFEFLQLASVGAQLFLEGVQPLLKHPFLAARLKEQQLLES